MEKIRKKTINAVCQEGICPLCGGSLEYGARDDIDSGGTFAWECENCGATGEEGFDRVFDGRHYNVQDADGNYYEIVSPENEDCKSDAMPSVSLPSHESRVCSETQTDEKANKQGTRRLHLTIQCMAIYDSGIDVPVEMSLADAIEYAKAHLKEVPLGVLEYVRDSDVLDEDNCDFDD